MGGKKNVPNSGNTLECIQKDMKDFSRALNLKKSGADFCNKGIKREERKIHQAGWDV